jgi:hypothetical protein
MQNHRNIKIYNSVKLTNKDGTPDLRTIGALEKFADRLEKTGYKLLGAYKGTNHKIKAKCAKGHHIEIKPNDFALKHAGCQQCFLLKRHGHEKTLEEFHRITKRKGLTLREKLDFSKGAHKGLKEHYHFTCKHGHDHWLRPWALVHDIIFNCHSCYIAGNVQRRGSKG